jgi:predicted RNA-binding protein associated with RNAse of E/G family
MPRIYRIRYIPAEIVDLSSDTLLFRDPHYLITRWKPIKPRNDIAGGISCVFLDQGWKISIFLDKEGKIDCWYCDIIDIEYDQNTDTYSLYDLLTDIKIKSDGSVEVIDLDELASAFDEGLISSRQISLSLKRCNNLLNIIYNSDLPSYVFKIIHEHAGLECNVW